MKNILMNKKFLLTSLTLLAATGVFFRKKIQETLNQSHLFGKNTQTQEKKQKETKAKEDSKKK